MSEMELIEAVKSGNNEAVKQFIDDGAELNQQDKQGWTALNWAAAKGNLEVLETLLQAGADPFAVGRDLRTPEMIALAAGHAEAVKRLRRASEARDAGASQSDRKYCAAVHIQDLRRYSGWPETPANGKDASTEPTAEEAQEPAGDEIVFLHQDYTVTKSMWPGEDVIFNDVTDQWKTFCNTELRFSVPDILDLIVTPAETAQPAA